jgi:hypothetical protein
VKGFAFPAIFPHAMFLFFVTETILLLYIYYSISEREIVTKKSYLVLGLVVYIAILFVSAFLGSDFNQSFWSSYSRMTGIVTWLHLFCLCFVASAILDRETWKYVFRSVTLSGLIIALSSFLGPDGLNVGTFNFLEKAGTFLGNTTYSGMYLLLIFFISVIGFTYETSKKWMVVYIVSFLAIIFNTDFFNFGIFSGIVSLSEIKDNPILLY